ncbi:hypothetical protein CKAH01_08016 [Colletotrichum kahawae]|uniref:Uncharacterized protein n=1 Tax=Colletotrichum kahawae TaxID=34407 RepID=A0AAD9Y407_COLKA|nr:hypothetical protein CKAH01_08016 [Colletotrichum kahawae]
MSSRDKRTAELENFSENGEEYTDINKDSSWEVVNENSSKIEIGNLKRARSQKQNNTSKKHVSQEQRKRNPKKSKNEDRSGRRENNNSESRRGDAEELYGSREE